MNLVSVSTTVASMEAGAERTWMYLKRVVETNTRFMSHKFVGQLREAKLLLGNWQRTALVKNGSSVCFIQAADGLRRAAPESSIHISSRL